MIPTKALPLAAAVLLSACINLPDVEAPQNPPDSGTPDSGNPPSLTLTLVAPSGTTYTNGTVSVQLQLQGDTPEQVELLADDQPLTTLVAPYTFSWDTTSVAEGTHRLTARARIGDKTFSSEAREVVVDRTPPQVESRTPTPGAQDVWVRQPIQATFSEPLKPGTLTSDSVKLVVGGTEVASTSSLSTDGTMLTVTPATRIIVPNAVQLLLTATVTDLAGNQLVIPAAPWEWSLPTSFAMGGLSAVPGTTDADQPFLQVSSQREPFIVWREESDFGDFNIYASRWTGSEWEALGSTINSTPLSWVIVQPENLLHMLRLDSSNTPVVAWIQPDGTEIGIHVKYWSSNQWMPIGNPLNAFPGTTSSPFSLSLAINTNNRPVVAWEQMDPSTNQTFIHVWQWTGQTWAEFGSPLPIARASAGYALPALALDRNNKPVVAWSDGSSDRSLDGINVRRWTGSSWERLGTAVDVNAAPSSGTYYHRLILDTSDNPVIAWSETDGSVYNIHVHRWTETRWESLGEALSAVPGETHAGSPDLAMDARGNIFIMWAEEVADKSSIVNHFWQWTGAAWEMVGPPVIQANSRSSLSIDNLGRPFMAWSSGDATSFVRAIRVHRYNY